jgi:hypothetical protein
MQQLHQLSSNLKSRIAYIGPWWSNNNELSWNNTKLEYWWVYHVRIKRSIKITSEQYLDTRPGTEWYLRLALSRADTASLDYWFDDMCSFFKLGHVRPRPSIKVTRSIQSSLFCAKHSESSFMLGQFITCKQSMVQWINVESKIGCQWIVQEHSITDLESEQGSDSQRIERLEELRLGESKLEQTSLEQT